MIKLSVLICSTHTRSKTFLPVMMDRMFGLYNRLSKSEQDEVEILVLVDNKKMMLGQKRNSMIDIAQGKYIVFVDDDDRIEDGYLTELLEATKSDSDVITFNVSVTLNGGQPKICHYSKDYHEDYNTYDAYYRLPNHICCVKREISMKVSFPNVIYGEDAVYARLLKPLLKTEHRISKVLYHYDYHDGTTETQEHRESVKTYKRKNCALVDVIILSNAKTSDLKGLTQKAIDTCITGANGLTVNVIVIEQRPNIQYKDAQTVFHTAHFNYNGFANLGIKQGKAEWVMVANNDLVFRDGWLHNLIAAGHPVVSAKCPNDSRQTGITKNTLGYTNGVHFSGWCFMMKRYLWEQIGGLDDCVDFWCSDDVTIEQVKRAGVTPMIVHNSLVEHLQSTTFKTLPHDLWDDYTWKQVEIFNQKYGQNKFHDNPNYVLWKSKQSVSA